MAAVETKKKLSEEQREELLRALKARFEKNMGRHKGLDWAKVQGKLQANAGKLWSLHEMERTGGEPDAGMAPAGSRPDLVLDGRGQGGGPGTGRHTRPSERDPAAGVQGMA